MDEYEHGLFKRWAVAKDAAEREQLYSEYGALRGLRTWIDNKAAEIAHGTD